MPPLDSSLIFIRKRRHKTERRKHEKEHQKKKCCWRCWAACWGGMLRQAERSLESERVLQMKSTITEMALLFSQAGQCSRPIHSDLQMNIS